MRDLEHLGHQPRVPAARVEDVGEERDRPAMSSHEGVEGLLVAEPDLGDERRLGGRGAVPVLLHPSSP